MALLKLYLKVGAIMGSFPGVLSLKFPYNIREQDSFVSKNGTIWRITFVNDVMVIFTMENNGDIIVESNYDYSFDEDNMLFDPSKPRKMNDVIVEKEP